MKGTTMKKIIILALSVLCLLLVLVSCGNEPAAPTDMTETAEPDECAIYGHEYQQTVVKPTCSAEGYTEHKCIHCGDTYKDNFKEKLNHAPNLKLSYDENGHWYDCKYCGERMTDVNNHDYRASVITKSATCHENGEAQSRCSKCGYTKTETVLKLTHIPSFTVAVLPTTTSDGKTSGHKCSLCGEILDGFEPIPKLTVSAQNDAKELPIDFYEFKKNINEMRREYTANFEYPELPILSPEIVEPALTDEEARALATERNETSVTKEQAKQDVDIFFRALHDSYASSYLFGEEKFTKAREDAIKEIESLKDGEFITSNQLRNIIYSYTDKIIPDLHFPHRTCKYVQYYYYYAQGLFLHKDTSGYYLKNGNDKWYMVYIDGDVNIDCYIKLTISPEGELVYTLGQKYLTVDETPKPVYIVLKNGETEVNYGISWTLSDTDIEGRFKYYTDIYSSSVEDGYNVIRVSELPDPQSANMRRFAKTGETLKGEDNVILDFRGNGGGSNATTWDWLRNFTGENESWHAAYWIIESPLIYYCHTIQGHGEPFVNSGKYVAHGWTFNDDYQISTIGKNDKTVFWLTDNQCGSSGDASIRSAQEYENMIVIGTHTAGCTGVGGGWFTIFLPNSGLAFEYQSGISLYDGKNIHSTGIDPDIWVPSEYALELTIKMCEYYGLEPGEKKVETYGNAPERVDLDKYASTEELLSDHTKEIESDDFEINYSDYTVKNGYQFQCTYTRQKPAFVYYDGCIITDFTVTVDSEEFGTAENKDGKIVLTPSGKYGWMTVTIHFSGEYMTFRCEMPGK